MEATLSLDFPSTPSHITITAASISRMEHNRIILLLLIALALVSFATCAQREEASTQDQLSQEEQEKYDRSSKASPSSSLEESSTELALSLSHKSSVSSSMAPSASVDEPVVCDSSDSPQRMSKGKDKLHGEKPIDVPRPSRKEERRLAAEKKQYDYANRIAVLKKRLAATKREKTDMIQEVPTKYRHLVSTKYFDRRKSKDNRKMGKLKHASSKLSRKHGMAFV